MKEKKKLWGVVVGYGNRGQVYADYTFDNPEEFGVAAVVDPNKFKLQEAQKRYGLSDGQLFESFEEFLKAKIPCDFVINATMDQYHYETAMQILEAGYDMLIEKPIVPNKEELLAIQACATQKGCKVFVCHVLRYTPYYRKIKKLLNEGVIGDIITMEMNEHVIVAHYLAAYDRGKWNSEAACGSGFLLAKSCHDLDIMCWLNNATAPKKVSSFGGRRLFVKENAPEDASEFCYQCKHESTCPYSALKQYLDLDAMPFLVWNDLDKPLDEITREEKEEFLKRHNYGRCAYLAGGDLVDRQNIIVEFENGSCCTFTLVGGTTRADRYLHIVGTKGEIEGKLEKNKFILRKYDRNYIGVEDEIIDISKEVVNNAKYGGHNGGDFAIMHDLIAYLNGDESSVSITKLEDSINGHLCVYAAEKSRKEKVIVCI
jgi:predicted dehydrogenase